MSKRLRLKSFLELLRKEKDFLKRYLEGKIRVKDVFVVEVELSTRSDKDGYIYPVAIGTVMLELEGITGSELHKLLKKHNLIKKVWDTKGTWY